MSLHSRAHVLQLLKPVCLEPVLRNKRSPCTVTKKSPRSPQLEKTRVQQWRPNAAKNKQTKNTIERTVADTFSYQQSGRIYEAQINKVCSFYDAKKFQRKHYLNKMPEKTGSSAYQTSGWEFAVDRSKQRIRTTNLITKIFKAFLNKSKFKQIKNLKYKG